MRVKMKKTRKEAGLSNIYLMVVYWSNVIVNWYRQRLSNKDLLHDYVFYYDNFYQDYVTLLGYKCVVWSKITQETCLWQLITSVLLEKISTKLISWNTVLISTKEAWGTD